MPIQLPPPSREWAKDVPAFGAIPLEQLHSIAIVGARPAIVDGLRRFIEQTGADELMIVSHIYDHAARVRSFEIVADARTAIA